MVPSDEVTDTGNEGRPEESESVKINFGKMSNTWMKPANAQPTIVGEFSQLSNKKIKQYSLVQMVSAFITRNYD